MLVTVKGLSATLKLSKLYLNWSVALTGTSPKGKSLRFACSAMLVTVKGLSAT